MLNSLLPAHRLFINLQSSVLALVVMLIPAYALGAISGASTATMDPPHDVQGCLSCHLTSAFDEPNLIPGGSDPVYVGVCKGCHNGTTLSHLDGLPLDNMSTHSSASTSSKYGNWYVGCKACHNQHKQEQDNAYGTTYGKFIKDEVNLEQVTEGEDGLSLKSGKKAVKFTASTGSNSFADGYETIDGICQVCHTKTTHFRNDGTGSDQLHTNVGGAAGKNCMICHVHSSGFKHCVEESVLCNSCHYPGSPDAPEVYCDAADPLKCADCHHTGSHVIHLDTADLRGPGTVCISCHDLDNMPKFKNKDGSGSHSLSDTDICNTCHSNGGTYDGVNDTNIGVKYGNSGELGYNWANSVYEADKATLKSGNEKWCATCHDEEPALISGVYAPNVVGDEDGAYTYGTGWGYYKTGHGLEASEQFPSKGGVETLSGRPVDCDNCHDFATAHIDGLARTFDDGDVKGLDPAFYRQGYRLKLIGGQEPYVMPRPTNIGNSSDQYRVCFQIGCHDFTPFNEFDYTIADTNFISYGGAPSAAWRNRHEFHLVFNNDNLVAADWSGVNNSRMNCVTCHNVHGSTRLAMVRDGKLTGREPGQEIWYKNDNITYIKSGSTDPPVPEDLPLSASDGTAWNPASSANLCAHCHPTNGQTAQEDRLPFQDVSKAPELDWVGGTGFVADGVEPDSGTGNSMFTFGVSYSDLNNDSPVTIEVWVDLDDSSTYDDTNGNGDTEKFAIFETDILDTNLVDGKVYSKSLAIAKDGDGVLNYRFFANDGGLDATGAPTADSTLTITNNSPVLTWTAESYFETDGVHPNIGGNGTDYLFRVTYTDADGECPPAAADIQVVVDGTAYDLDSNNGAPCDSGRIYFRTIPVSSASPPEDLIYRFTATDGNDTAVGDPNLDNTLTILAGSNNPPQLDWAATESCLTDGVNPALGLATGPFEFKVMYTDIENTAPSSIEVWVDLNDDDIVDAGEKQTMSFASGDGDYTNGESYSYTWTFIEADAGVHKYAFFAQDTPGTDAVGEPTQTSETRTVEILSTTGAIGVRTGTGDSGPIWYNSIQDSIDAIDGAHTVLVYSGTYNEDLYFEYGSPDSNMVVRSVCGPDVTTIQGTGTGATVHYYRNSGNILDGFQVTDGTTGIKVEAAQVTINNCKVHGNGSDLGGIAAIAYFSNYPTLTLTNSEIYENTSDRGAGVRVSWGTGHTIDNTIIRNNTATGNGSFDGGGGIYLQRMADITISNSVVKDNVSSGYPGGGLYVAQVPDSTGPGLTVIDSIISGNTSTSWGGGVYTANSTTSNFSRTSIIGNTGSRGGAIGHPNANTTYFENCIITDNQADQAGAIKMNGGSLGVINSTIANNQAITNDGGVFFAQNSPTITIRNSILWGNQAATFGHISSISGGSMTISDSIIQGGDDGDFTNLPYFNGTVTVNISGFTSDEYPWFVGSGDYHIQSYSPAIDNASATYAPAEDIDGQNRPQGAADDIGADEFIATGP